MATAYTPDLSIIVPVYNEEQSIDIFLNEIEQTLQNISLTTEIVFIDDGSHDQTFEKITSHIGKSQTPISVIQLSRNFGKDVALSSGIDHASGAALVPMDIDLQDPPELLPEMIKEWQAGSEMVIAVRESRDADSWFKRKSAQWFYRLITRLSKTPIVPNAGDYRLIDRKIVDIIKQMPEKERFMKGIFAWPGFKTSKIYYKRPERRQGESKWSYWKLWNFALGGIFSFSSAPLRIWTYLGLTLAIFALGYMFYIIFRTLILGIEVPGYASLTSILLFSSSLNMIGLGILGEYVARIFNEVKGRPLYVIRQTVGFDTPETVGTPTASQQ